MDDPVGGSHAERLRAVQGAEPGEHLCSFPESDAERRRLAAAFIESGLAVGDRVIYVSDERPGSVLDFLRRGGVDGDAAAAAGQLRLVSFAAHHGARGAFAPAQAAAEYRAAMAAARSDGYPGLHVAGDMGWMARHSVPLSALVEWERGCTALWAEVGAVGLCQYDTRLFDSASCTAVGDAHTAVAQDDCTLPLATITPSCDPWGLRLEGELDVSNAAALERALRARVAAGGSLAIDMANVGFVDLECALVLYRVATALAAGEELRVRRAPNTLRRLVQVMEWDDPRLRVEGR